MIQQPHTKPMHLRAYPPYTLPQDSKKGQAGRRMHALAGKSPVLSQKSPAILSKEPNIPSRKKYRQANGCIYCHERALYSIKRALYPRLKSPTFPPKILPTEHYKRMVHSIKKQHILSRWLCQPQPLCCHCHDINYIQGTEQTSHFL